MALSVLIPARNEPYLKQTVESVLRAIRGDTDVIVVADGAWPIEPIPLHPRVQVVKVPTSIGQRAAVNLAARISTADYIMKLDAHCDVADGFDVALMTAAEELGPTVTQIPVQYNLHVFDWVCGSCQTRQYQGPTPGPCACGGMFAKDMVWKKRDRRRTTAWRFNQDLKFQYWPEYQARDTRRPYTDTLCQLGACWFLSRAQFWRLGGLDEGHGGWGQMGVEVSCKTWLSGGRQVVNHNTWFAHLFRTQGGDFGFPYALSGSAVAKARAYSQALWREGRWPLAVHSLDWLIDKFSPVVGWPQKTKGVVYYSDCRPDPDLLEKCRQQLQTAAAGLPIVSVTLKPVEFGRNIVYEAERGVLTMFRQILVGLEALDTDYAFLCEHDVAYHPSHFQFTPPSDDTYYYNEHVWKRDVATGRNVFYYTKQTSGLCANRQLLIQHYRTRIASVEAHGFSRRNGFEPGTRHTTHGGFDDVPAERWMSEGPNIDLRHAHNLTASRWSPSEFRNQKYCQGWTEAAVIPAWEAVPV